MHRALKTLDRSRDGLALFHIMHERIGKRTCQRVESRPNHTFTRQTAIELT
jgi:hypothetical protein